MTVKVAARERLQAISASLTRLRVSVRVERELSADDLGHGRELDAHSSSQLVRGDSV